MRWRLVIGEADIACRKRYFISIVRGTMDGHCFGCASKFGFFTREHSCHKCGHAYCKTCLPHKTSLPGKDPKKQQNVCNDCFKLLQQTKPDMHRDNLRNEGRYSPPENFKKRVAALHEKEQGKQPSSRQPGPSQSSSDASSANQAAKYKDLAPADRDIAMRLDKLKEDRKKREKPVLTQSEIEERLRNLQGHQPSSETNQNAVLPRSNKTVNEQFDDLLDQMTDEVALDARLEGNDATTYDPAAAKRAPTCSGPGQNTDPLLPDEDEMKQLTEDAKKLLGESSSNTEQPSRGTNPQPPGGPDGGEDESNARKLAEEANKLMEAARAELHLEEEATKRGAERDAEIAGRLAHLKGAQSGENTGNLHLDGDSDEDEEKASQRLIQQILEEDKLDDRVAADGFQVPTEKVHPKPTSNTNISENPPLEQHKHDPPGPQTNPDELPWCCICNEDAIVRCVDCDNDLYCKRCFREGHRDYGIESHKVKPYKPPNK